MEEQRIIQIPYFIKEIAQKVLAWLGFLFCVAIVGMFFFLIVSRIILAFTMVFFEESQQDMVFWGVLISTWFMIAVGVSFKWVNKNS